MSGCVSDLALEQFLVDELAVDSQRDHIIGCVRCRAQLAAKQRVGMAYMDSRDARDLGKLLGEADQIVVSMHARVRKITLAVVAVAVALGALALLPRSTTLSEAEVLVAEQAWAKAIAENDVAGLDAILADDYRSTDASGRVRTKADDLSRARAKTLRFDVYDSTNVRVRVWGDTAVVTGESALRGSHAGKPFATTILFTDTLARIDGRWRAVSAHISEKPD
jgi:ketosteroid isomerase-like protein